MNTQLISNKWIMVEFICDNGYESTITSIPENQKHKAIEYLEKQGYLNIRNFKIK